MREIHLLSAKQREDLGDARLIFDAAAHNLRAAVIGDETVEALRNALVQAEQGTATVRRVLKALES